MIPNNYFYLETGEKEHDHPLDYSEIDAVQYEQNVYGLDHLPKVKEASLYRIKQSEAFQKIDEAAKRRKEQRDDSEYTLSLENHQTEEAEFEALSEEYKDLLDKEVLRIFEIL